jgi:hypothetical protein
MLLHIVSPPHSFNTALAVHYALLSGVEGVTLAAHFNTKGGLGGPGLEDIAAGARHCGIVELGMDLCFHSLCWLTYLFIRLTIRWDTR